MEGVLPLGLSLGGNTENQPLKSASMGSDESLSEMRSSPSGNKRWFVPTDKRHKDLFDLVKSEVMERGKSDLVLFW